VKGKVVNDNKGKGQHQTNKNSGRGERRGKPYAWKEVEQPLKQV
jgi:hypothetical protein